VVWKCDQMSKLKSQKNTYGWARAEVLGALVNSVFLIALCFTIFVEAIQRLTHSDKIEHVDSLLYVGIAGFAVNVIGLLLFHNHGHSHGGHGHQQEDRSTEERQSEGKSHEAFKSDCLLHKQAALTRMLQ